MYWFYGCYDFYFQLGKNSDPLSLSALATDPDTNKVKSQVSCIILLRNNWPDSYLSSTQLLLTSTRWLVLNTTSIMTGYSLTVVTHLFIKHVNLQLLWILIQSTFARILLNDIPSSDFLIYSKCFLKLFFTKIKR